MKSGRGLGYCDSLYRSETNNIALICCVHVEPSTCEEREGALAMVTDVTVQGMAGFKDATAKKKMA